MGEPPRAQSARTAGMVSPRHRRAAASAAQLVQLERGRCGERAEYGSGGWV